MSIFTKVRQEWNRIKEHMVVIRTGDEETYAFDFTNVVRAGMDLLDKVNPGWQDTLDLSTLDLESDQMCVLGQSWPHYAKMHGLIDKVESGDYKEFADTVLGMADDASDRNALAAAIGCALSGDDLNAVNMISMLEWEKAHPGYTFEDYPWTHGDASAYNEIDSRNLAQVWEQLTKTWITEIQKARQEGRWEAASVPAQ